MRSQQLSYQYNTIINPIFNIHNFFISCREYSCLPLSICDFCVLQCDYFRNGFTCMDYTNVDYTNMDIAILKAVILIKVGQIFFNMHAYILCTHACLQLYCVVFISRLIEACKSMSKINIYLKTKCGSYPFQAYRISNSGQGMYFTTRKPQKGHKHEALASHSTVQRRTHCSYT